MMLLKNFAISFVTVFLCFVVTEADSQTGFTSPEFSVTATFPDSPIKPGDVVYGSIFVTMPDGWHVYAPGVKKYNSLNVDTGDGPLKHVRLDYPPAKTIVQLGTEVPVYGGTVEIRVAGIAPPSHAGGDIMFSALVTWQGCTDNICLPPESKMVSVPLKMLAGDKK
ncbi:hypothetical protein MNBD_NITROSPINAE01-1651 [hydrothermal vent metagenome]|uniref:Thiol:disulfide interchange protein DsbD N-terminal domain-containing protein n=1 Tax=hydrothermal vent metagenome TaxID=652676 RepID=A0A3B1CE12_9ZZZZ